MELLRFFTAGNVDDGKSTLIGRLLYDSNSISTDIIETLTQQTKANNSDLGLDVALLTDGLRAEREQGITIDVAYKFFATDKRKFIIADTPGHEQYTRNMFTGASNCDLAIILIDARKGVTEQTKRHAIITSLLRVPEVLVCINKMDLADYSEDRFLEIVSEFSRLARKLDFVNKSYLPVSALLGENVVNQSENMRWYSGPTLLEFLENVSIPERIEKEARFQVQYVIRPQTSEHPDYRGFAGRVISGTYKVGDTVTIHPSGLRSTIKALENARNQVDEVKAGDAAVIHLADEIDISRGDLILPAENSVRNEREVEALICWMDQRPLYEGDRLQLQQNSFGSKSIVREIRSKIDIHSYEETDARGELKLNEIARVTLKLAEDLAFDSYAENRGMGSFILVHEGTNNTVAAGMVV